MSPATVNAARKSLSDANTTWPSRAGLFGSVTAARNVAKWTRRKHRLLELSQLPGRGWVEYEPYGTVLMFEDGGKVKEGDRLAEGGEHHRHRLPPHVEAAAPGRVVLEGGRQQDGGHGRGQGTTAALTQTTGGSHSASNRQCSPSSAEANSCPVRVPK